ncbi:hypothetical protein Rsub_07899 [Raphidocelis subcapitata]|uniref:ABC1 atypical kinase-like domain-containing protein n=1 Tax=Raphidocelis subcapitata TaxID=307507 RepID=A0A2V0P5R2_9CHLO|nr:hypothetical protein Rsub_07899 [Raphidocelis subcapitata]|eukprot:GBF95186.1 hypothetical protein Rsub_07899 [Raphidocelis subcapitata]
MNSLHGAARRPAAPRLPPRRPAGARRPQPVLARSTARPPARTNSGHSANIPMRTLSPDPSAAGSPAGTGWSAGGAAAPAAAQQQPAVLARAPLPASRIAPAAAAEAAALVGARAAASGGAPFDAEPLPLDTDFKWARDSYSKTQRTADTWVFFLVFRSRLALLDQKWSYAGGFSEEKKAERARGLAKYLVASILDLGPTFIKVGQLSSTRSDLFPPAFVEELAKLQDRVPAFAADKAVAIIEKDLGRPIGELFASFERRPIAAASLGQVHRAVLRTGEEVVVKVQRPGLKQLFDIDLENLRLLAEQLDRGDENRDFKGIYQECAQVLYEEIDYINEGRNADRFRRNFRGEPWVRAPVVHWEFCSSRVLTLEYLPGIKISDKARLEAAGLDIDLVARRATEAYLIQILRHGFFHLAPQTPRAPKTAP